MLTSCNTPVYVANKADRSIEEMTYAEWLTEFVNEDVCGPNGVTSRHLIREDKGIVYRNNATGVEINENEFDLMDEDDQSDYAYIGESVIGYTLCDLRYGRCREISNFDTEEEADEALYSKLEDIANASNHIIFPHGEYAEAVNDLAGQLDRSYEVIERYLALKAITKRKEMEREAERHAAYELAKAARNTAIAKKLSHQ